MLFYIVSAIFAICYSLVGIPILLVVPFAVKNSIAALGARCILYFARICDGITYEIVGRENIPEGPYLIAAEHQSPLETLILYAEFRGGVYVMKKELRSFPILGLWWILSGTIFIDRKSGVAAMRKLLRGCEINVKKGRIILMFPEGTRASGSGRSTREYGIGVAAVYEKLAIPIVPVVLNTGEYWPRGIVSFRKRKGRATLKILPPIEKGLSRAEFMQSLKERVLEGSKHLTP